MPKDQTLRNPSNEKTLSKNEAYALAEELKEQLQKGKLPLSNPEHIELLVAGLGDSRGLLRRTFAESLGEIGTAALPALRNALHHHPNVTVRRAAAKTLRLVRDPSALPDLLEALINDPDPVVQGSSVGAMAIFGERAVTLLLEIFKNPKSTAIQTGLATWALAHVGAEAPNALRKAAQSHNVSIRTAAIAALGEQIQTLEDNAAKDLLLNALDDPSKDVRAEATRLIGQLNDTALAKKLIQRLSDSSSQVRKNAAISLMKLNALESISEISKRKSTERDYDVVRVFNLALQRLIANEG